MALEGYETYDQVKNRLDEIVEAVGAEGLSLDDALALYEEAVSLGLRASDLLEEGEAEAAGEGEGEADAPAEAGAATETGENTAAGEAAGAEEGAGPKEN